MNVSYKGMKQELAPKIQAKLDVKFAKLSKLLEQRGEREAHVILTQERRLNRAEITIQFYDHQLAAEAADVDLFNALSAALLKLEKQAVKQRGKWREHRRDTPRATPEPKEAASPTAAKPMESKKVFRVNHHERRKPMTLEEAMLMMDKDRDYLAYRDAEKDCVSVLVRRRDGHFDLIEA